MHNILGNLADTVEDAKKKSQVLSEEGSADADDIDSIDSYLVKLN